MVRNIAGAPGSALESSMPVYFGHGPHATEAEFSSLVEAGKQAHEAARTPEERAAALDKLGLSPAGVKKQLEAGTLSFQQGRLLNGAFNGVMEHDSTLPGTQAALEEWVSHPKNQHMAQWLHQGTPEQRAYVAGQFFKQTRHRAEGSLLATPERMEEVRRGHLGGLHPDWGKPGAIAPGSAPDDGPAGLERIPLQGGGAAHMPSGTWTAHDYETLDQHPDIRKLPHAAREAAVDTLLSQYHEQLTSQPGFNAADQQKFHQTAQALRDRVAALKTWGDTAGQGADLVKDAAKSEVGTHLAAGADLSIFDPYGNLRVPGKNLKEQSVYEAQKVKDTTQRLAQPAAEKKIDAALQAIHQDIRNGSFPLAPGEAQDKWIDELSAKLNPQRQQWFDAVQGPADPNTPEGKKHLAHLQQQTLASPENRALIQEFIRTGNMARWKELEHNLKKTPQRAQTEEDQQNSLKNDPLVRGLSDAAGTDLGEYMQGAPGTVAGYFVPGMGSLGKGSRMGRLARRAAGIAANIGGTVAQNTIENPDSDFEDHKRAVIADYATSLGMKPFDHAKAKIVQKIKENLPHRPGAGNPGSPDSAPPPSEGQTFEERRALEEGSMPFTPTDTAQPQPGDGTGQPPPSSQHPIPHSTTPTTPGSSSEKQPQTTANDGKPSQTPSPARESDLPKFGAAQNTIEKLKAQQSPLSPDQQKELAAAEHTVASTIEYNLLRKQAVIEQRGRTLHPTEAAALKNAQATLARLAPAGTNAPPVNAAEAGTATPGAPQPQGSTSGSRLQFSQGGTNPKPTTDSDIVDAHRSLSQEEDAFQLGKSKPDTSKMSMPDALAELAKSFSQEGKELRVRRGGGENSTHYMVDTPHGTAYFDVDPSEKTLSVNSAILESDSTKSGGGSNVYQLAATFAHQHGLKFVADYTVSPKAQNRRISHMVSSMLRHGTSDHFDGNVPFVDSESSQIKTELPGWKPGAHDHNLALALRKEHDIVMAAAKAKGIDLSHLTYDPETHTIINGHTAPPLPKELCNLSWTDLNPEIVESARQHFLGPLSPDPRYRDLPPGDAFQLYTYIREETPEGLKLGNRMSGWCDWHGIFTIADHRAALEAYRRGEWVTPYPNGPTGSPPPLPKYPTTLKPRSPDSSTTTPTSSTV